MLRGEAATRAVQAALVDLVNQPSGSYGAHLGGQHLPGDVPDPAMEQGYRDGYEAGLAEARRQEAARIDELRVAASAMARAADALVAAQTAALGHVEAVLPQMAFELTELLLGRELELAQNAGRDAVARALAVTPEASAVTVRLNPHDAALVGDLGDLAGGRPLTVVADPQVAPGDCLADADTTRIDATLAGALDRVRRALTS
ncbi:MAG TPA: FliH/SctL family protein [Acidimicrobiia bacterium]|nr:FliH/SctL family protein [Acidimicrobiia bacterium]